MKEHSVSIAESKKSLSRIIDDAVNHKKEVIVTRRGKPVAVIVPYDEYLQSQKRDALAVIMKTRHFGKLVSVARRLRKMRGRNWRPGCENDCYRCQRGA